MVIVNNGAEAELANKPTEVVTFIGQNGGEGAGGVNGSDGISSYLHIAYSNSADGSLNFNAFVGDYVGVYVDHIQLDSTDYRSYTWRRFTGLPGTPGSNGLAGRDGLDGTASHVHIKYSNDGGTTFTANNGDDTGNYLGQYTDTVEEASTNPARYRWSRISGENGLPGTDGIDGTPGVPGTGTYFHVAYADSADGSLNFNQTSGTFIGTYVDSNPIDSTFYSEYGWNILSGIGEEGLPGLNGDDGLTSYLHIKYSNDNGVTFTASNGETPGAYIGQYVDFTIEDSNLTSMYKWALIKGTDGIDGLDGERGTPGAPGTATYFHVAYADSADGSVNFNQSAGFYIGTYVDSIPLDSTNHTVYTWRLLRGSQGENGIPGTNGANGLTSYLHLKYSNDGGATFTANNGESTGDWLGQYVDFTVADSSSPSAYTWSLIKGTNGEAGAFLSFRGEYSISKSYTGSTTRLDAVKYNGAYYVAQKNAGQFAGIAPTSTAKWNPLGTSDQFDSVATNLLLAELAYIENLGVKTLRTSDSGARFELNVPRAGNAAPNDFRGYHANGNLGIDIGIEDGLVKMNFYDSNGNKIYELGQSGIVYVNSIPPSWVPANLTLLSTNVSASQATLRTAAQVQGCKSNGGNQAGIQKTLSAYRYFAGVNADAANNQQYEGYKTDNNTVDLTRNISDGWYIIPGAVYIGTVGTAYPVSYDLVQGGKITNTIFDDPVVFNSAITCSF